MASSDFLKADFRPLRCGLKMVVQALKIPSVVLISNCKVSNNVCLKFCLIPSTLYSLIYQRANSTLYPLHVPLYSNSHTRMQKFVDTILFPNAGCICLIDTAPESDRDVSLVITGHAVTDRARQVAINATGWYQTAEEYRWQDQGEITSSHWLPADTEM